jgi:glutathione S-transferase
LDKNEHRSTNFRQMNPLHQVPTLDDNGFFLTDSHAIISYLATNSNLMSNDRRLQARINQLLFFDFELFKIFCEIGVSFSIEK